MNFEEGFGEIRSLLQHTPTVCGFSSILRALNPMILSHRERTVATVLPYVTNHLETWPNRTRYLELSTQTHPALIPRDGRLFSLVRSLCFRSNDGTSDRKGRQLGKVFADALDEGRIESLELEECSIHLGGYADVFEALSRSERVTRLDTLDVLDQIDHTTCTTLLQAPWLPLLSNLDVGYQRHDFFESTHDGRLDHLVGSFQKSHVIGTPETHYPNLRKVMLDLDERDPNHDRTISTYQPHIDSLWIRTSRSPLDALAAFDEPLRRRLDSLWFSRTFGSEVSSTLGAAERARVARELENLDLLSFFGMSGDVLSEQPELEVVLERGLRALFLGYHRFGAARLRALFDKLPPGQLQILTLDVDETVDPSTFDHPALEGLLQLEISQASHASFWDMSRLAEALPSLSHATLSFRNGPIGRERERLHESILAAPLLDRMCRLEFRNVAYQQDAFEAAVERACANPTMHRFTTDSGHHATIKYSDIHYGEATNRDDDIPF